MKTTHIVTRLTLEEVTKKYEKEIDKRKKKKRLCIRLGIIRARTAKELSEDSGLGKGTVKDLTAGYNKFGPSFIDNKPGKGGDRYNKKVDREKERAFFVSITTGALKGKYRTADEVAEAYKTKVRGDIGKDSIYRILYRLGWKSGIPRQSHPKKKSEPKKNLGKISTGG